VRLGPLRHGADPSFASGTRPGAIASSLVIAVDSAGFRRGAEFSWLPSVIPPGDDIDGLLALRTRLGRRHSVLVDVQRRARSPAVELGDHLDREHVGQQGALPLRLMPRPAARLVRPAAPLLFSAARRKLAE
jgi:hypothetical protein